MQSYAQIENDNDLVTKKYVDNAVNQSSSDDNKLDIISWFQDLKLYGKYSFVLKDEEKLRTLWHIPEYAKDDICCNYMLDYILKYEVGLGEFLYTLTDEPRFLEFSTFDEINSDNLLIYEFLNRTALSKFVLGNENYIKKLDNSPRILEIWVNNTDIFTSRHGLEFIQTCKNMMDYISLSTIDSLISQYFGNNDSNNLFKLLFELQGVIPMIMGNAHSLINAIKISDTANKNRRLLEKQISFNSMYEFIENNINYFTLVVDRTISVTTTSSTSNVQYANINFPTFTNIATTTPLPSEDNSIILFTKAGYNTATPTEIRAMDNTEIIPRFMSALIDVNKWVIGGAINPPSTRGQFNYIMYNIN